MYCVGRRIDIQRIVLALAGGDDRIAEADDEVDEFHAGAGLVAGAQRVDDAKPLGLMLEIGADGDVGLDIHHHQMLAVLHGDEADLGADGGPAGGIDDDVDLVIGANRLRVIGDGGLAALQGRVEGALVNRQRQSSRAAGRRSAAPSWPRRY